MVHFVYVNGRVEFLNEGLMIGERDGLLGSATGLDSIDRLRTSHRRGSRTLAWNILTCSEPA
jgi:hypothetical protein